MNVLRQVVLPLPDSPHRLAMHVLVVSSVKSLLRQDTKL